MPTRTLKSVHLWKLLRQNISLKRTADSSAKQQGRRSGQKLCVQFPMHCTYLMWGYSVSISEPFFTPPGKVDRPLVCGEHIRRPQEAWDDSDGRCTSASASRLWVPASKLLTQLTFLFLTVGKEQRVTGTGTRLRGWWLLRHHIQLSKNHSAGKFL